MTDDKHEKNGSEKRDREPAVRMTTPRAALLSPPKDATYEHVWPRLSSVVRKIFTKETIPQDEWQESFFDVYKVTVWNPAAAYVVKDKLKELIQSFMRNEKCKLEEKAHQPHSLLKAYLSSWQRFTYFYLYIPMPFAPLERFFASPGNDADPAETLVPAKQNVDHLIKFFLNETWIESIFNVYGTPLITQAVEMVTIEREDQYFDREIVINMKDSCVQLGTFFQDKLYFYRNNFERIYVFQAMEYYRIKSCQYFEMHGIIAYMSWAYGVFGAETERANRYLEPHSLSKLLTALVYIVVTSYKSQMIEQFEHLLEQRDVRRLLIMFDLLNRLAENGVLPIQTMFQNYVFSHTKQKMLDDAQALTSDAERYVHFLLDRFNHVSQLIAEAFASDPRFFTARDIAFSQLMNDLDMFKQAHKLKHSNGTESEDVPASSTNAMSDADGDASHPPAGSDQLSNLANRFSSLDLNNQVDRYVDFKSAELLANYTDMLLRKTNLSRRLTMEEVDERLKNTIVLLKYIANKDMFMKFYKAHLTRRLLLETSNDMDKEELTVVQLRNIGMPADFINKINRMFLDIKISEDMNRSFRLYARQLPLLRTDMVAFKVLNLSAWSRTDERISFGLPCSIERALTSFESFYQLKHSGRNIHWQHQLSSGLIIYHSNLGDYELDVTSYQLCLLQAWNDHAEDELSFDALGLKTNLSNIDLRRTIWSLISHVKLREQLLHTDKKYASMRDFTDASCFRLNLNFALFGRNGKAVRRGRYNFIGRLILNSDRNRDEDLKNIHHLRCLRIQEAIMKVMKTRGVSNLNDLYVEVIEFLKHMFLPTKEVVLMQIKDLIDMQLIQHEDHDRYVYIA